MIARRERTRHLIELGGLVVKSGLDTLLEDDRAALYGALLRIAAVRRSEQGEEQRALWRRTGKRAFEAEAEAAQEARMPKREACI